ncbi:MAG: fimbrillin family protein [Bacteroidales bacterium]|nr:fimbrillin family protein [Bacteroidales bacterium]MCL2133760.1 fimbrillin family protein [Bacteroidales bacterium]
MKRILLFFMLAMLLMGGCKKDENGGGDNPSFKLTATMGLFTSSGMPSELQVKWPAEARIGLFEFDLQSQLFLNSNREFTILSGGAGNTSAIFGGTAQTNEPWSSGQKIFYAYYPYDPAQTMATAVAFALPVTQTQVVTDPLAHIVEGIFMTTTEAISLGQTPETALTLHQATTVLQFDLSNQTNDPLDIDKLVISAGGATMYKSGVYNFRQNEYTFSSQDRTMEITLLTDEPVTLAVGESMTFYLTIFPLTVAQGGELSLAIHTDRDVATVTQVAYPDALNFEAGKFYATDVVITELTFATPKTIVLPEEQNSFMVAPSDNGLDTYLTLPITRVNEFWTSVDPSKMIDESTPWIAEIIWQDFDLTGANEVLTITPGKGSGTGSTTRIGLTLKYYPADQWGNAVVGIRKSDGAGNPASDWLWSWHIWITDFTVDDAVPYTGSIMAMDRNLGAKDKTPGSVGSLGLFYQCTRKDPFPGAAAVVPGTTARAATTLASWPVEDPGVGGSFAYAVQNPTTFVKAVLSTSPSYSNNAGDWLLSPMANQVMDWRREFKAIQDPCPKGWKIADVLSSGAASTYDGFVYNTTFVYNAANHGYFYNATDWFPLAGWLYPVDGALDGVGERMNMATMGGATRTFSPGIPGLDGVTNYVLRTMWFTTTSGTNNDNSMQRAGGFSVRCVRFTADDN